MRRTLFLVDFLLTVSAVSPLNLLTFSLILFYANLLVRWFVLVFFCNCTIGIFSKNNST